MTEPNPDAAGDDPQPLTPPPATDPGAAAPVASPAARASQPPAGAAPKKKRRRRVPIWLRVVAVVVLLLLLLVVFAPTIASTGPVRSFVLGRVNETLNGRVEAAGWSLGWTSGLKANGVRVHDASGRQILQLTSVTTQLTLLDVIRGDFSLGDVVIDGLDFLLRREADGEMNFVKVARAKPPVERPDAPAQPAPAPADPAAQPAPASKLPNLSGNVVIRNSRGTFEDVTKGQTVQFTSIDGAVKVPDINGPIENSLTVTAATPDGQRGTLKLGGSIDVIENNEVRVEAANVDEKIEVAGVALPALVAFMPPGTIDTMRGDANAVVQLKLNAGQGGFVEAEFTSDGFAAGGPALKGDTLQAKRFVLSIPRTSIDMSAGHGSWANWPIRTGGEKPQPIRIALVQDGYEDTVRLGVNATPQSLMNLGQNLKPGAPGQLDLAVNVDLGGYARQLPNVFQGQEGRRLRSAKLAHTISVTLAPDRASIDETLDLTDIALANADGSPAKLQPIHQELSVATLGGGWAMPELRDIKLVLNSGFAKAEFGGAEISNLAGSATGDLARTQAELGQFIPMDGVQLGGTFAIELESSGDVTNATAPTKLAASATFTDLRLDGVAGFKRFEQGHTRVKASAEVLRDASGVKALRDAVVAARTGQSEQALTLDTELTATVDFIETTKPNPATGAAEKVRVAEVPQYAIRRLTADLTAAQRDFPAQFAGLSEQGLRFESGVLALAGSGSYRADAITFDVKGGANDVELTKAAPVAATASAALTQVPPAAGRSTVLSDYSLSIDAAGSYAPGDGSSATTRLTRLAISDNQKMLSLAKGEQELIIATGAAGVQPSGEVRLGADLKKLSDLSKALSGEAAQLAAAGEEEKPTAELESGRLDAALKLGPAAQGLLAINATVNLTNLTVRTEAEPIENEKLALVVKARSTGDFGVVNVDEAIATGRLMNAKVTGTVLDFAAAEAPDAPPLALVTNANLVVDLTDLEDLHALVRAISPAEPEPEPAPSAKSAKPQAAVAPAAPAVPAGPAPEPRRQRFEAPAPRAARQQGPRGDEVIGRRRGGREPVEPRRALPEGPADPDGTVTVAPADDAPAPPAIIRGGAATIRVALGREGGQVVLTPEVLAKGLTFQAGDVTRDVGDITFKTAVRMAPAASARADAGFMERLSELTIPSLVLSGAGADLKLEKPLVVKDPAIAFGAFGGSSGSTTRPSGAPRANAGAAAALSAVLSGTVRLGEFLPVLEALNGAAAGKMYPYDGAMTIRQELSTAGGAFRLVGRADVNDFSMTGDGAADFAESRVGFANSISLNPNASVLQIENLALAMETTKAIQMSVAGAIHELDTARRFENMVVRLDYDAAKLWDVLRPIMDPETGGKSLEEITLAGQRVQEIRIDGTYPAGDPNAIRSLRATGGIALDTLATRGLTVSQLDLSFLFESGVLRLEHVNAPAQADEIAGAVCNGGVLSFQGLTVDLNGEHPRLNIPEDHPLIRGATINPVVADSIIGRFVNPAFAGADRAKGMLDVTVVRCTGLALDDAMQSTDPAVSGRAELTWSLTDLMLGQPELVALVTKLKPNALNEPGFKGEIKDGKIVIEGGQVYSDMTFQIDEYALGFNGGIGLAQNKLVNFSVALPPALFGAIDDKFERVVPKEGYKVALTGTTDNWINNATKSILPIVADLGVKSAIGGLFDRESDEEKAERRRRVREAREKKKRAATMPADAAAREDDDAAEPASEADDEPRGDEVIGRRPGDRPDGDDAMDAPEGGDDAPAAEPRPADDPLGQLLERAIGGKRETDAEKKARRERVRKERREREERERQRREQEQQPQAPRQ